MGRSTRRHGVERIRKRKLGLISTGYLTKSIEGMKNELMLSSESATGRSIPATPSFVVGQSHTFKRASQQQFQTYKALNGCSPCCIGSAVSIDMGATLSASRPLPVSSIIASQQSWTLIQYNFVPVVPRNNNRGRSHTWVVRIRILICVLGINVKVCYIASRYLVR